MHVHGTLSIYSGFAGSIGDFPLAVPEKFHCSTRDLLTLTQISGVSVTDLKYVCVHLCESTQILYVIQPHAKLLFYLMCGSILVATLCMVVALRVLVATLYMVVALRVLVATLYMVVALRVLVATLYMVIGLRVLVTTLYMVVALCVLVATLYMVIALRVLVATLYMVIGLVV